MKAQIINERLEVSHGDEVGEEDRFERMTGKRSLSKEITVETKENAEDNEQKDEVKGAGFIVFSSRYTRHPIFCACCSTPVSPPTYSTASVEPVRSFHGIGPQRVMQNSAIDPSLTRLSVSSPIFG